VPRSGARAPGVRKDGESTPGNVGGGGQPNGRIPQGIVPRGLPYGEGGQLRHDLSQTPAPPGISDHAAKARAAMHAAGWQPGQNGIMRPPGLTPLFAPTQRPWEPVTAGAPAAEGPTNPMAQAGMAQTPGGSSMAALLSQAAQASGSSTLQELATRAQSVAAPGPALGPTVAV